MGKEDNIGVEVIVDKEEMPKIRNHEAKSIIMGQCSADIIRDLDILNLIVGKMYMNKQIQQKLTELICFF